MTISDQNNYHLRNATLADKDIVLTMRNAPFVRAAMLSDNRISEEQHEKWYNSMLSDATKCFYLFKGNNKVLGVTGFFNISQESADWTFYLKDEKSSKGTGYLMCKMALDRFFDTHQCKAIKTSVKSDNTASIKLHEKLRFQKDDEVSNQSDCISCYTLEKKCWIALRKHLD